MKFFNFRFCSNSNILTKFRAVFQLVVTFRCRCRMANCNLDCLEVEFASELSVSTVKFNFSSSQIFIGAEREIFKMSSEDRSTCTAKLGSSPEKPKSIAIAPPPSDPEGINLLISEKVAERIESGQLWTKKWLKVEITVDSRES